MLGIPRWTPWTELAGLHRDLNSIFGRAFSKSVPRQTADSFNTFTPAADVKHTESKSRRRRKRSSSTRRSHELFGRATHGGRVRLPLESPVGCLRARGNSGA